MPNTWTGAVCQDHNEAPFNTGECPGCIQRERDEAMEMVRRLVDSLEPEHYVEPDPQTCETCAVLADAREMLQREDGP